MEYSRYIIGIDLGTTNSCVAYVDTDTEKNPSLAIQSFRVPQLVSDGLIDARPTLPSCCYLHNDAELKGKAPQLPWLDAVREYAVGAYALDEGGRTPTCLVESAKSWLCHAAADRNEKILPFDSEGGGGILSPVEATARYLQHIKEAWNHSFGSDPEGDFDAQDIVLTVPASFDEVARGLTVEAAKAAGYRKMTLLEEPQAAFYSWIQRNEKGWEKHLTEGATVLVCDVGGGTTDFSLIEVKRGKEGVLGFQRMAVGNHLLLGGDNMDAAVAHMLEERLPDGGASLDSVSWQRLGHEARKAKEAILGNGAEGYTALVTGSGSSVVRGSASASVSKEELHAALVDGFFGQYAMDEALAHRKTSGIRTMGLPYEDEPSITKHMAAFLERAGLPQPDAVLFNGGSMKPRAFQDAVITSLQSWFPEKNVETLEAESLDLAVSRGAAYYGKVRRGLGVRIGSGLARTLYLGVGGESPQALVLMTRGAEEGAVFRSERTFRLAANRPVAFQLYGSQTRLDDSAGDLVAVESESMHPLPPIHTVLKYGKKKSDHTAISVTIEVVYTEIGTVEVWLQSADSPHRWRLEFQMRSVGGQENTLSLSGSGRRDETVAEGELDPAKKVIQGAFVDGTLKPDRIMEALEGAVGQPRADWAPAVCRELVDTVLSVADARTRSADYEARWWNLLGYLLRPGFGSPLDDYRMREVWKVLLGDKGNAKQQVAVQQCVAFRRMAGGFNKGQQVQLMSRIMPQLAKRAKVLLDAKNGSERYLQAEQVRAVAALELIDLEAKVYLGDAIIKRVKAEESDKATLWALARLGARQLVYGSLANVVPARVAGRWAEALAGVDDRSSELDFALGMVARKSDHRELNLSSDVVERASSVLAGSDNADRLQALLNDHAAMTKEEQAHVLGDALPAGLTLE